MLGNILKLIRVSNEIDIVTVSNETHLRSSLINDIEIGKAGISLSTLDMFSKYYCVSISNLLLLNDFQEHFKVSDEEITKEIKKYYRYKRYQKGKQKIKQK